jgi:hypothetical protein
MLVCKSKKIKDNLIEEYLMQILEYLKTGKLDFANHSVVDHVTNFKIEQHLLVSNKKRLV